MTNTRVKISILHIILIIALILTPISKAFAQIQIIPSVLGELEDLLDDVHDLYDDKEEIGSDLSDLNNFEEDIVEIIDDAKDELENIDGYISDKDYNETLFTTRIIKYLSYGFKIITNPINIDFEHDTQLKMKY